MGSCFLVRVRQLVQTVRFQSHSTVHVLSLIDYSVELITLHGLTSLHRFTHFTNATPCYRIPPPKTSSNPKVYLGIAHYLQLPASKVAMVAAHVNDLREAAKHGLRTVYVKRTTEWGPAAKTQSYEPGEFDIVVDDLVELAELFG